MADIELVIKIDEELYNYMQTEKFDEHLDKRFDYQVRFAVKNGTPLPRCKDCKYFEYESVAKVDGIPLIVAHEICSKWGNGCKTREDGYCFLYEPQPYKGESEDEE